MTADNKSLQDKLKNIATDNRLSCGGAFALSKETGIFPDLLGIAMNDAGIKITECQMGLFGCGSGNKLIKPAESVSDELEELIFSFIEDGKLECRAAWQIASELKIRKIDVAAACEKLKIKINRCQLGAF